MNQQLWQKFDNLRRTGSGGYEELAAFFAAEGVRFSVGDLPAWGRFFATRLGRSGGPIVPPDWLARIIASLAKATSAKTVCDPWAGYGFLAEVVREACGATEASAITRNVGDYELARVLVPEVKMTLGEPLSLLDVSTEAFDVVASVLPMNTPSPIPLQARSPQGQTTELTGDLAGLVMVSASLHLAPEGVGLFVVTPSFFFSPKSVRSHLTDLGLGIQAAFSLEAGTFAPYAYIPTLLLVVNRHPAEQMFVAKLSGDERTDVQVLENFRQGVEGGAAELGRVVDARSFTSLEQMKRAERFDAAQERFGAPPMKLGELATAINLGRPAADFAFQPVENSLFVPLIGSSDVVDSPDALTLKKQNYAQVAIAPSLSTAGFVARFLNSDYGRELREQAKSGLIIPKLSKTTLRDLRVFVPDLETQRSTLDVEARLTAEENTLVGLQNEVQELRRELWSDPRTASDVQRRLSVLSRRLGAGLREHAVEQLGQWFETQPFPLASILRAWQATPSHDYKAKYEHLLHFFEATAEFVSVILLSAFSSNETFFSTYKLGLSDALSKQNQRLDRATFGTWKTVVEFFGRKTRGLLSGEGKKPEEAEADRTVCANLFADPSLSLPEALSRKDLASILAATNKMRNDWSGHGGVVAQHEAQISK